MFKKIAVVAVIALACMWVAKRTHAVSYATTLISKGKDHICGQIPRELELARVQQEIQHLDRDYQGLLGPIAEKMAAVKKLEREITTARTNQQEQKANLLALTRAIDARESQISYNDCNYNLEQAKVKLHKDFANFKKLELSVVTKERLLEAEAKNLAAIHDQLNKLTTQKREFEIRLATLEAEEATLKVARVQTPLVTDEGRVADIKNTLDRIEQSQVVEQNQHLLQQQYGSKIGDAQPQIQVRAVDVDEIRDYLQGIRTSGTKVVDNK
jgi:chromosome segregation ATPase